MYFMYGAVIGMHAFNAATNVACVHFIKIGCNRIYFLNNYEANFSSRTCSQLLN